MPEPILKKINYFKGFFLEANDLQAAEAYRDQTRWLHNLHFHGPGVLPDYRDELKLTVNDAGNELTVGSGLAIDGPRSRAPARGALHLSRRLRSAGPALHPLFRPALRGPTDRLPTQRE